MLFSDCDEDLRPKSGENVIILITCVALKMTFGIFTFRTSLTDRWRHLKLFEASVRCIVHQK